MITWLYPFTEPLTSRQMFVPITTEDNGTKATVFQTGFSWNSLGSIRRGSENDCIHYHLDYSLPNSAIEENWVSPGSSYEWTYQGTTYKCDISAGGISMTNFNPSGWYQRTRFAYYFVSVNTSNGSLYSRYTADYYHNGELVWHDEAYYDTYSIFGRWDGYNGNLFRSYWPTVYSDPIPEMDDDQKNRIIDSVRRELDDRLRATPPPSEAFRDAANSIGNNMNTLANLLEGVDFIQDLLSFKVTDLIEDLRMVNPEKMLDTLKSAWMGYRYSYSTTKSDIEGMTDYLLSYIDPNDFTNLKRYAQVTNDVGTTRCKVVFSSGDPINNTLRTLETTGMMLNAYAAWDMVPLSFVVDWFLPIGDFLEDLSSNWVSQPSVFNFGLIEFSSKVFWEDSSLGIRAKAYKRWVADRPPAFETYSSDPSTNTIVKRVFDGLALTVGG